MLSFEEFFLKKKIDLTALQAGQPSLYAEFSKHYAAMGEKSFDHSKKFWFNRLRKSYLLAEGEPAPAPQKVMPVSDHPVKPVSEVVPVGSAEGTKPAGFKPRFKAGAAKSVNPVTAVENPNEELKSASAVEATATNKPAGFKPRFRADVTKPAETAETKPSEEAKAVPSEETEKASATEASAPNKPVGFKPRFKAGVTKPTETAKSKPSEEAKAVPSEENENAPATEETATNKPTGFKPRFKPGVTKSAKPNDDQ